MTRQLKRAVFTVVLVVSSLAAASVGGAAPIREKAVFQPYQSWQMPPAPSAKAATPAMRGVFKPEPFGGYRAARPSPAMPREKRGPSAGQALAPAPSSNPSWQFIQAAPTGDSFNRSYFVTPVDGWAVGWFKGAYHTTDGGKTWAHVLFGPPQGFHNIFFFDATHGWAVGNDSDAWTFQPSRSIWRTTDGGASWKPSYFGYREGGLGSVRFTSATDGWAAGQGAGEVLHTTDGGATWATVPLPVEGVIEPRMDIVDMSCAGADNIWFLAVFVESEQYASQILIHSGDGGASWEVLRTLPPIVRESADALFDISFSDTKNGWAGGWYGGGHVWRTTDGGKTWAGQDYPAADRGSITQVVARSAAEGWMSTDDGCLFRTTDGGAAWVKVYEDDKFGMNGLNFNGATGFACGQFGSNVLSTDGGGTWNNPGAGIWEPLVCGQFSDVNTGVVVTAMGSALRTTDGGITWAKTELTKSFRSLKFSDALSGWAAGTDGVIFRTTDGGSTWAEQDSGTADELGYVQSPGALLGWAAGNNKTFVRTVDGGAHWTPVTLPWPDSQNQPREDERVAYGASSLFFLDADRGWAAWVKDTVGKDEFEQETLLSQETFIFKTTDGGGSWSVSKFSDMPFSTSLSIQFLDDKEGWCIGFQSKGLGGMEGVFHTNDGGETWFYYPIAPFIPETATRIRFLDRMTGLIVGPHGEYYTTWDGGDTWHVHERPCPSDAILDLCFPTKDVGYLFTYGGAVLKTQNGGGVVKKQIFVPHVASSDDWETFLEIGNTGGWSTTMYIHGYDAEGSYLHDADFNSIYSFFHAPSGSAGCDTAAEWFSDAKQLLPDLRSLTIETGESADPAERLAVSVSYRAKNARQSSTAQFRESGGFHQIFADRISLWDTILNAKTQTGIVVENTSTKPIDLYFVTWVPDWGKAAAATTMVYVKLKAGLLPRQQYAALWDEISLSAILKGVNPFLVTSGVFLSYDANHASGEIGELVDGIQGVEIFGAWGVPSKDLCGGFAMRGQQMVDGKVDQLAQSFYFPVNLPRLVGELDADFTYDGTPRVAINFYNPSIRNLEVVCNAFLPSGRIEAAGAISVPKRERKSTTTDDMKFSQDFYGMLELNAYAITVIGLEAGYGSAGFLVCNTGSGTVETPFLFSGHMPSSKDACKDLAAVVYSREGIGALAVLMNPSETAVAQGTITLYDALGKVLVPAEEIMVLPKGSIIYHLPKNYSEKLVYGGMFRVSADTPLVGLLTQYNTLSPDGNGFLESKPFIPTM